MKFEYEWTKDDLRKELINKRFKTNVIFFIMGLLLYIWFMSEGLKSEYFDNTIIVIGGIIFMAFITFILFVTSRIYVEFSIKKNDKNTNEAYGIYKVNLSEKNVQVLINKDKFVYNYKDITKLKKRNNYFHIRTKDDKIGLLFKKKVLGKDIYTKVLAFIEDKISC